MPGSISPNLGIDIRCFILGATLSSDGMSNGGAGRKFETFRLKP